MNETLRTAIELAFRSDYSWHIGYWMGTIQTLLVGMYVMTRQNPEPCRVCGGKGLICIDYGTHVDELVCLECGGNKIEHSTLRKWYDRVRRMP